MKKEMEEQGSSAAGSKSEEGCTAHLDYKKRDDDKVESEIKLENKKNTNSAGSPKREESMCEASSTRKPAKCESGVDEVKSSEEDQTSVGKASLQEGDSESEAADEQPDTEDKKADRGKKKNASEEDEKVALRGLGSSVRQVWGRESFSPVREVWGEEGFNERDNEEEAEEQEEQEEDKNEVENQNEGTVPENQGRSIGKRNLLK